MLKTKPWTPYAFIAPAVLLIGFIFAYPVAQVVNFSTRYVQGNSGPFVGLDNYRLLFEDPTFVAAAKHSAFLLLAVPIMLAISVLVSVLLYERARGWKVYRSVLFVPYILAIPVVGLVMSFVFQTNGSVNSLLAAVGVHGPDWLGDEKVALWTLMFVIIWREVGFGIILFLARLLALPEDQLEAARLDGAGWWARLRYVIVPELRGTIEFYVIVSSITMVAWVFGYVFTLTAGGPGNATYVVELYIYNQTLRNFLPGMSAAASVTLLAVTVVFIVAFVRVRARSQREDALP